MPPTPDKDVCCIPEGRLGVPTVGNGRAGENTEPFGRCEAPKEGKALRDEVVPSGVPDEVFSAVVGTPLDRDMALLDTGPPVAPKARAGNTEAAASTPPMGDMSGDTAGVAKNAFMVSPEVADGAPVPATPPPGPRRGVGFGWNEGVVLGSRNRGVSVGVMTDVSKSV